MALHPIKLKILETFFDKAMSQACVQNIRKIEGAAVY